MGANTGLGLEAARQLLTLGLSHLMIAVRSIAKGKAAASILSRQNPAAVIDVWALDMESNDFVQAFVRKCDTELTNIDYTILNAGIAPIQFGISCLTGHEKSIQVNYISTILLTILLLSVLKDKSTLGNPARLTVVNSITAHLCKFPNRDQRPVLPSFDDLKITPWDSQERYGMSKLLPQLFLVKLTEHVKSDDVIINMVDPGLTKGTGLSREASGALLIASKAFFKIAGRSVEHGAATYVDALLGHGKESHGCFLMNIKISPYPTNGRLATFYYTTDGEKAQNQVWDETMKELSFAQVDEIVASMK